jgi:ApbE superfamily uncharacterized protein (UPF0280 family)
MTQPFQERFYRLSHQPQDLRSFVVRAKESDLWVAAEADLSGRALESLLNHRRGLEAYIRQNPDFAEALSPIADDALAPPMVRRMLAAGLAAGTGPMAAVAGAIAQAVGQDLLRHSSRVMVENGGDIFMAGGGDMVVGLYAGKSVLSGKLGLKIPSAGLPLCLATSSGTVGHSLSFGRADAAVVLARDGALADACATALGNRVKQDADMAPGLEWLGSIAGITGGLLILGDNLAAWGQVELTEL